MPLFECLFGGPNLRSAGKAVGKTDFSEATIELKELREHLNTGRKALAPDFIMERLIIDNQFTKFVKVRELRLCTPD